MHIHGTQFQILEWRFGSPMTSVDFGWKDAVLVNANETVRLAVRFEATGGIFHCHFLVPEDDGMMVSCGCDMTEKTQKRRFRRARQDSANLSGASFQRDRSIV
jgi:FtsP/CotA-like multicopper oxidase with cupredoxin domain